MLATAVSLASILALTCLVHLSETKIVVTMPLPYTSHVKYHVDVSRGLVRRGHEVWITIPTHVLEKGYLDIPDLNIIPYATIPNLQEKTRHQMTQRYFAGKRPNLLEYLRIVGNVTGTLLKNESFIATIRQKHPDLIVIDNVSMFYVMTIIPYRLGVPYAFVGSGFYPLIMRVPFSPVDSPLLIFPYNNNMTFFQRVHNLLYCILLAVYDPSFPSDAVSQYAPEKAYLPLDVLISQGEIFLIEQDHILDYPKPTLPNVKLIGGTTSGPPKSLPPEFQSFMDSAEEGVVIVSFGSYVLDVPKHISDKILQVLQQLPMKSVFRSTLTSPDPKKILTAPWIPQNDLLGHPHTNVFVSHCGKSGQYEALYHAVPVVATPFVGDQPYNAERARVKGFAEVLDLVTCTAEQMKSTILTVANEPRYKQAAVQRSRLFKELYGVPMESAAYWLDHVMEYGGGYMCSAGQQMPLFRYMMLDVLLFLLGVIATTIGFVGVFVSIVCRCLRNGKMKPD